MHKCVRCGRQATSLEEINDGCPCGSKAFVFNKEAVVDANSIAGEGQPLPKNEVDSAAQPKAGEADGGVPDSYHARVAFTSEDVENIKVVSLGVFALELQSLSKNPVVLKDEEGIYYIKIPFEQSGMNGNAKPNGTKKKK